VRDCPYDYVNARATCAYSNIGSIMKLVDGSR
jgi:hypothetical protein